MLINKTFLLTIVIILFVFLYLLQNKVNLENMSQKNDVKLLIPATIIFATIFIIVGAMSIIKYN